MKTTGNVLVFQVIIIFMCVVPCSGANESSFLSPEVCSNIKKIEVHYKDYFNIIYLGNKMFTPELDVSSRYVQVLQQAVPLCCANTELSFIFLDVDKYPPTKNKDIESHVVEYLRTDPQGGGDVYRFYYPEFADKKERTLFDDTTEFVRLGSSPGHAVLMSRPDPLPPVFVGDIFVKSWAIMIFLVTFSWIVGMLAWMADHYRNPVQFPSPFYIGMVEGFWWSVVTMATVGYGDKAPKSYLARLLTIVWIMISTIFLSLFTANATSILAASQTEEDHTVTLGKKIGVFHSKHYVEFALNLGAQFVEYSSLLSLTGGLSLGQTHRIVIPNYVDWLMIITRPEFSGLGDNFVITNVFDHPFQIGMVLARDASNLTDASSKLLTCLRTTISGFEKKERSKTDLSTIASWSSGDSGKTDATALDSDNLVSLTYYCLMMAAGLLFIGLSWDGWQYYQKTRPQHQAADVEKGDNAVTDIHEIPSDGSSPKIDQWGAEPSTKYKMSIVGGETGQAPDAAGDSVSRESGL